MLRIEGARQHNLKGVTLEIRSGALTAIAGVSGSGKSSLAFDTIYAEGYRRYMDSLSMKARSLMDRLPRPDADAIEGLSPAVAISQRLSRPSPRSTVGSVTEIHAFLRLLFAHEGVPHCPSCGLPLAAMSRAAIVDRITALPEGTRVVLLAPLVTARKGDHSDVLRAYRREGFVRVRVDGVQHYLDELEPLDPEKEHDIEAVVDRIVIRDGVRSRVAESVETALRLGSGIIAVEYSAGRGEPARTMKMGERAVCPSCRFAFPPLRPSFFSPNSHYGMCPACKGLGVSGEVDEQEVFTAPSRPLLEGAIGPLNGPDGKPERRYLSFLEDFLARHSLPRSVSPASLDASLRRELLYGAEGRGGIVPFLLKHRREALRGKLLPCGECGGDGLRQEARHVKLGGLSMPELSALELREALAFLKGVEVKREAMRHALEEVRGRLAYLVEVGLGYLTLDRRAETLSNGELQRIRLATQVGSRLSGVVYVLDEPTVGLHPADTKDLLRSLRRFTDRGNTVIVVEHSPEVLREVDEIIELGPGAGRRGGEVVFKGTLDEMMRSPSSITGAYLRGEKAVRRERTSPCRPWGVVRLQGVRRWNLDGLDVEIPLGAFTVITGRSGAGKSTLAEALVESARAALAGAPPPPWVEAAEGFEGLSAVVPVDPSPLKRSARSNVSTYLGFAPAIRSLFAAAPEARMRGYSASRFSPNSREGRCESCRGTGVLRLEMVFLPDALVPCEDCGGTGLNREVLEIRYRGLNYAQVMEMEVAEAESFFANVRKVRVPLRLLREIGLGYLKLGQPSNTFSGGEAQRVKLAAGLVMSRRRSTLFVLDEPTMGLHFEDVNRLLVLLDKLVSAGHTVVAVEHDPWFAACADHIIELGPGGGKEGGKLTACGPPERVARADTVTGREVAAVLERGGGPR